MLSYNVLSKYKYKVATVLTLGRQVENGYEI